MSVILELSPEEEAFLQREAQARGLDITDFIRERVFAPSVEEESPDLKFLREEGIKAVRAAQEDLLRRNIGYVYSRDNVIVRHHADGSEEILDLVSD